MLLKSFNLLFSFFSLFAKKTPTESIAEISGIFTVKIWRIPATKSFVFKLYEGNNLLFFGMDTFIGTLNFDDILLFSISIFVSFSNIISLCCSLVFISLLFCLFSSLIYSKNSYCVKVNINFGFDNLISPLKTGTKTIKPSINWFNFILFYEYIKFIFIKLFLRN